MSLNRSAITRVLPKLAMLAAALLSGCDEEATPAPEADRAPSVAASAVENATPSSPSLAEKPASSGQVQAAVFKRASEAAPLLGIRGFATTVRSKPNKGARKLGYLRVGAKVPRSEEIVSRRGCKGGWYRIEPRGYVCAGRDATIDLDDPLLRAAQVRPRLDRPLPYRYGFVRATLPLYLRVPTARQQFKSEMRLKKHLEWYKEHESEVQKAVLGASDVPIDARGIPILGKALGELGREKNSTELGVGQLFGGKTESDPWPFWLREGQRLIPNISGFSVPSYAVFADRVRRKTGLAFIGSFQTDEFHLNRRFAVTTDLRLAPTTKVKPDSASPWHGVELGPQLKLPIALVRLRGARRYRMSDGGVDPKGDLARRTVHRLAGQAKKVEGQKYFRLKKGGWASAKDVGIVIKPRKWPRPARKGEKWIQINLSEQTLVLWEAKTPVYATLVSTGRPAIGDAETTNSTPRGIFRIYAKHISATMDSDQGGGRRNNEKRGLRPGDKGYVPQRGDGAYGVSLRRGHGTFKLRDVPHIQYFNKNYAIHGSYWHDVFGIARSHGCINLAPLDSLRVFKWTGPDVPEGWHGINAEKGTAVVIHK